MQAIKKGRIFALIYWMKWLANKIETRGPFYILARISYSLRYRIMNFAFPIRHKFRTSLFKNHFFFNTNELIEYFRSRKHPRFYFNVEQIEEKISTIPSQQKDKTIKEAENITNHNFIFRGYPPVTLNPVNWGFFPSQDSKETSGWRWDLNRHFYFTTLGFAYWYTKDPRFIRSFIELSSSWIDSNVSRLGQIKWDRPFEVAARINAWLWAYFLFFNCPEWGAESQRQFLFSLHRLTDYLYQVIEYHCAGNHILLEAKALALCAELFPEFKRAKAWAKKAWKILKHEIKAQICEDGVHAERSTMYHRIIAGELSELLLFCQNNGINKISGLVDVVNKMADFESWLSGDSGTAPLFGDAYVNDSYIRFSAPAISNALRIPRTASNIMHNDQTSWLLFSHDAPKTPTYLPVVSYRRLARAFAQGGYFFSRSDSRKYPSVLVWDCGPIGYISNPYHSHSDALSFTLELGGIPIIIDPGTEESNIKIRTYLRSTRAHNTVAIDDEDQSILGERAEAWSRANQRLEFWGTIPDCDIMIGSHDGYKRLPGAVVHTRYIIAMRNKYWLVFDQIEGKGSHKTEQRFHLAPGASLEWVGSYNQLLMRKEDACISLFPMVILGNNKKGENVKTKIGTGIAELEFGRIVQIPVINTVYSGNLPLSMAIVLVPNDFQNKDISVKTISIDGANDLASIEIKVPGITDKIYLRAFQRKTYKVLDSWQTDSRIFIFRHEKHDKNDCIFAIDATLAINNSCDIRTSDSGSEPIKKIFIN
jgi:uncharacterized heparinase superfamily protein